MCTTTQRPHLGCCQTQSSLRNHPATIFCSFWTRLEQFIAGCFPLKCGCSQTSVKSGLYTKGTFFLVFGNTTLASQLALTSSVLSCSACASSAFRSVVYLPPRRRGFVSQAGICTSLVQCFTVLLHHAVRLVTLVQSHSAKTQLQVVEFAMAATFVFDARQLNKSLNPSCYRKKKTFRHSHQNREGIIEDTSFPWATRLHCRGALMYSLRHCQLQTGSSVDISRTNWQAINESTNKQGSEPVV